MKAYIMSIAATTVISAVINMITPEKWSKYVGVVTGLVVTICIAQPIINITHTDMFEGFSYNTEQTKSVGESVLKNEIKTELEKRISDDVQNHIKANYAKSCKAETVVKTADNGDIKAVKKILIYGERVDSIIIGDLRERYGAEEVKYVGNKKTAEKSE